MSEKKSRWIYVVYAIVFVMYSAVVFGIGGFFGHNASFWLAYIFVLLAGASVVLLTAVAEERMLKAKDWLFRLSLIKTSALLTVVQVIAAAVFMSFSQKIPTGIVVMVHIVLLGTYWILVISSLRTVEKVEQVHEEVKTRNRFMKLLGADVASVQRLCEEDAEFTALRKELDDAAELIRYADPMSPAELADLETDLFQEVKALASAVRDHRSEDAESCASKVKELLLDRAAKCKILK